MLDPLTEDFLKETFNRGLGKATSVLTAVTGSDSEIHFSVPGLTIDTVENFKNSFAIKDKVCGVRKSFNGEVSGTGFLFFSSDIGTNLINLLLKNDIPIDYISEIESDVLAEVGNVLINHNLKALVDELGMKYQSLPAHFDLKEPAKFFSPELYKPHEKVVNLTANLIHKKTKLVGNISLVLCLDDLDSMLTNIKSYLDELMDGVA